VGALAFTPDNRTLASSAFDHTMRLWDVQSGASRTIDISGAGAEEIEVSPDGATIYTLSRIESGVRAWDAKSGAPRGLLRGHDGPVRHFTLSPDGARMATAGSDGSVRLWDLQSGESRALRGHAGPVFGVAFTPDGRAVVSGGTDGTVRLWRDDLPSDPGALKAWIRDALRRPLPAPPPALRETGQRLTAPSAGATGSRG
jgi:WD40 repeat protein